MSVLPSALRHTLPAHAQHPAARLRRGLIAGFAVLVILVCGATGYEAWRSYQQTLADARTELLTLSRALSVHFSRSFRLSSGQLANLGRDADLLRAVHDRDESTLYARLQEALQVDPQSYFLTVADAWGNVLASSLHYPIGRLNIHQRDYFNTLRNTPGLPYTYGQPVPNLYDQRLFVPIAAPLHDNGQFAGVLLTGIDPDYFYQFYRSLGLDEHTGIDVLRADGTALISYPDARTTTHRHPLPQALVQQQLREVSTDRILDYQAADGEQRLLTLTWLSGQSLAIGISRSYSVLLKRWYQDMRAKALLISLLLCGSGLLLGVLLRQLRRVEHSERQLRLTQYSVDHGVDLILWVDLNSRVRYANLRAQKQLGWHPHELYGRPLSRIAPSLGGAAWMSLQQRIARGDNVTLETSFSCRNGQTLAVEVTASVLTHTEGDGLLCLIARDVSELKQAAAALANSDARLRLALQASGTGLYELELATGAITITGAIRQRLDIRVPEQQPIPAALWLAWVHPDDQARIRQAFEHWQQEPHAPDRLETSFRVCPPGGRMRWVHARGQYIAAAEDTAAARLVGTVNDVTDQKENEEQIERYAHFDALTGLANRHALYRRLGQAITSVHQHQHPLAVLFVDLDKFKTINDTLGHAVGDVVLREVAGRLSDFAGPDDILARLGGDEFLLVLPGADERAASEVAACILTAMSVPVRVDGRELPTTPTIGVSLYPRDGEEADDLIRNADIAMYQAKARGRNTFQLYTPDMNAAAAERLQLQGELRNAHLRGEIMLHYQPQIDVTDGHVVGCEALMRWKHPTLGMVSPGRFIPLAEESGLIITLGNWAIREACRQAMAWQRAGLPPLTVAVNLSGCQFQQSNFTAVVADALADTSLPPQYLELELTESIVMHDVEQVIATLTELKALGVQLSIDDFGTGYSSLNYLKRFPVDLLKIDQGFVRDVETDPSDAAIVRAIIALGKILNLRLIAEGVETQGQLDYLHAAGVDFIQGYYFSRPLPAEDMATYLAQRLLPASPSEAGPPATSAASDALPAR
ncbi:EAL domain-containing protein [Laribacter hongkongensis]|uniref:EAL domain-containing protein n=1 Tax=Laribacter hongkongensis TaxID=168471 RepID=UPI001EFD3567|nr:EAL domain-containing protein [Laribacter hongkongensis]MCG9095037.1 EAL domain-containing protein [Laribacter hongkongensis]